TTSSARLCRITVPGFTFLAVPHLLHAGHSRTSLASPLLRFMAKAPPRLDPTTKAGLGFVVHGGPRSLRRRATSAALQVIRVGGGVRKKSGWALSLGTVAAGVIGGEARLVNGHLFVRPPTRWRRTGDGADRAAAFATSLQSRLKEIPVAVTFL